MLDETSMSDCALMPTTSGVGDLNGCLREFPWTWERGGFPGSWRPEMGGNPLSFLFTVNNGNPLNWTLLIIESKSTKFHYRDKFRPCPRMIWILDPKPLS